MHHLERVIEVCLLAALTWPLVRLIASESFRRAFPRIATALVGSLAFYALVVGALARSWPAGLRLLTVVAAVAFACERWRARPGYGRARGLPPGSLALVPVDSIIDPAFIQNQVARHGPVFKIGQLTPGFDPWYRRFRHPVACVVGLREGLEVLRRRDEDLTVPVTPFSRFIPGGFLRYMEEPRHAHYREIVQTALSRTVVRQCEDLIVLQIRTALARLPVRSTGSNGHAIALGPALHALVFDLFVRVFFGIEPETAAGARLRTLYPIIDHRNAGHTPPRDIARALDEITAIVTAQIDRLTTAPAHADESTPACFALALARAQPQALQDPTVLGNLIYLLHTTGVDVASLLEWILRLLTDHPAWIGRLRAEERTDDETSLVRRVVVETLRLAQTEFIFRRVRRDIQVGGFVIPAGWILRICIRESHRSAAVFADPERFDPDRFLDRTYATTEFSPFGAFRMACLGADLTLTVARAFVREWVRAFDWTVAEDGPLEFRDWHWKPSSRLRLHLTQVAEKGPSASLLPRSLAVPSKRVRRG